MNTTAYTLENLKQMGCRPTACDNRPKSFTFRPSINEGVLGSAAGGPALFSKPRLSPWLSTNQYATTATNWSPSQVPHSGMCWIMEQANLNESPTYGIDIEVQFQFMKPLVELQAQAKPPVNAVMSIIDASPDGIEGGLDKTTIPLS